MNKERTHWIPDEALSMELGEEEQWMEFAVKAKRIRKENWDHFTPEFIGTKAQTLDIKALFEEMAMAQDRFVESRIAQKSGEVRFETELPVSIFFVGDVHLGSLYSDHERFVKEMGEIKNTPNAYIIWMSNLIDNGVPSRFPDVMLTNSIPPDKQVAAMRKIVQELDEAGKVLGAVVSDCHEGWCVSSDTSVLTKDGWKYDVDIGEDILTFNRKTEKFEYLPVEDKYRGDYSGEMYHFENDNVDLLCTPDHKLLYQYYYNQKKKWVTMFQAANKRTTFEGIRFWQTAELDKSVYKDSISHGDLLLLAWIITDGTIRKDGAAVIYQSTKHKDTSERIREVLRLNNLKFSERLHPSGFGGAPVIGFRFRPEDGWLEKWFSEKGKLSIPREVMHQSPSQMRLFLRELMLGDGSRREFTFITASEQLAADVQELAIRAGVKATVRKRKGNNVFDIYMKEPNGINGGHFVYPVRRKEKFKKEKYSGEIWCPNTKNGTVIVRRNGKVCVTGNTAKATGQDINALMFGFEGRKFPVLENGGRLTLKFPGTDYTVGLYHKIGPFRSNFNYTHGLKQMNRLKQNGECDIMAGAHYHCGSTEEVFEGTGDNMRLNVYVQSGSYKGVGRIHDQWSQAKYGSTGQPSAQSVTLWPNERRMSGHTEYETGMLAHQSHYLSEMVKKDGE